MGLPIRARATFSFLLLPPLYWPHGRSRYWVRSTKLANFSISFVMILSLDLSPRILANRVSISRPVRTCMYVEHYFVLIESLVYLNDGVKLWTISNALEVLGPVTAERHVSDEAGSRCHDLVPGHHSEGCCLPCSIHTQQTKALILPHPKGESPNCIKCCRPSAAPKSAEPFLEVDDSHQIVLTIRLTDLLAIS